MQDIFMVITFLLFLNNKQTFNKEKKKKKKGINKNGVVKHREGWWPWWAVGQSWPLPPRKHQNRTSQNSTATLNQALSAIFKPLCTFQLSSNGRVSLLIFNQPISLYDFKTKQNKKLILNWIGFQIRQSCFSSRQGSADRRLPNPWQTQCRPRPQHQRSLLRHCQTSLRPCQAWQLGLGAFTSLSFSLNLRSMTHLCLLKFFAFLVCFYQGWTDVKLTSPQLSRESLYKLSLKHLTLQNVSSGYIFTVKVLILIKGYSIIIGFWFLCCCFSYFMSDNDVAIWVIKVFVAYSLKWFLSCSDSRNPFVEHAVQYCVAAARATLDQEKKDSLEKLLLQGNVWCSICCYFFFWKKNEVCYLMSEMN